VNDKRESDKSKRKGRALIWQLTSRAGGARNLLPPRANALAQSRSILKVDLVVDGKVNEL
jgi:hypothetical protein